MLDMGKQILISLAHITYPQNFDISYVHTTPLWLNSDIKHLNEPIIDKKIINTNINTLIDIYDSETMQYCT